MTKLPAITAKDMERVLRKLGFERTRQKGSHAVFKHPGGRWTTVPFHLGQDLPTRTVRDILKEIEISPEDFIEFL